MLVKRLPFKGKGNRAFYRCHSDLFPNLPDRPDEGFEKIDWSPTNLRLCKRGEWNDRMLVETVLSMLTLVCQFKKVMHRAWAYFKSRVGFTMALFNILVQWYGLPVGEDGFVPLSIAEFSL